MAKHGKERGGWCCQRVVQPHGRGLWKGIWLGRELFWERVRFQMGAGDRVRFWQDRWCDGLTLAAMFPLIYVIAVYGKELVASVRMK